MIRSKVQDKKLLTLLKGELDVKLNSFGLKIRKLENEVSDEQKKLDST